MLMTARGDRAAYGKLYRKYFTLVTSYIVKLDRQYDSPEDLAQEVFVHVWQNRTRYRPNATMKTYLFSYVRKVVQEKHSKIARKAFLDTDYSSYLASNRFQSCAMIQSHDRIQSVKKAIASLSDK